MVCTGNICRSPMAEALLRDHLSARGIDARVSSAGTMAWNGPPTPHALTAMHELGIDIVGHTSRPLTSGLVERADLVLAMTRDHVGRVTSLVPSAQERVFLVRELLRLSEAIGPPGEHEEVRAWAARVAATRPDPRVVGRVGDEVADPVGEPLDVYRATAARLDHELGALAARLVRRRA